MGRRLLGCLAVFALILAACSDDGAGNGGGEETSPASREGAPYTADFEWGAFQLAPEIADKVDSGEGDFTFKYVNYDVTSPFFAPTRDGIADAAEEFGVDAEMVGPTTGDAQEQANTIESLTRSGVDGLIVVCAGADVLTPVIDSSIEQGIPVLTSNIDCPSSHRFSFVGQDLVNSGHVAGEQFMRYFRETHPEGEGKYEVALFGSDPSFDYVRDRIAGFEEVVDSPDIELIGPFATTFDTNEAFSAVESAFRANPGLDGIYMVDEGILAGGEYIDRQGLNGEVTAVGFNFNPGIPELIQANAIQASVGQFPYEQGYEPVRMLYEFLADGTVPDCVVCDVGADVVNQDNIDDRFEELTSGS